MNNKIYILLYYCIDLQSIGLLIFQIVQNMYHVIIKYQYGIKTSSSYVKQNIYYKPVYLHVATTYPRRVLYGN